MDTFRPFSLVHGLTIVGIVAAIVIAIAARRRTSPSVGRGIDYFIGGLNLLWWVTASVHQLMTGRWEWSISLPIQVCDLSAILAGVAMFDGARWARAMLYYVAIGLSSWALITPDLTLGPASAVFWIFFVGHGAAVGAAIYDLGGRGFRPGWRDFAIGMLGMTIWLAIVFPLNAIFGWNYGYVGDSLAGTTNPIHFLGPWPWRVLWLALSVTGLFALMTLPWPAARHRRKDF
jgi:hypothetical integral membrane protein (TIGR02206 family)